MTIRAVRVAPDSVIDNLLDFDDAEALARAEAASAPFRWIGDADWAIGLDAALAAIGNVWDGEIPATFVAPRADTPEPGKPATLAESSVIIGQRQAAFDAAALALHAAISDQQALIAAG